MFNNRKKERGAVTVEATIALSAFMFAIVTLYTIVNIATVQAKVAYAINNTAKEISQYSYLYSLTGLNDRQHEIYEAGRAQTADVEKTASDLGTLYDEIMKLGDDADPEQMGSIDGIMNQWGQLQGDLQDIGNTASSIKTSLENIASNPKALIFGIAKLAGSNAFDYAKSRLIAAPIAKGMCKAHLVNKQGDNVELVLKQLGVVPSNGSYMDGLDFSESTLFPMGTGEITICCSYDVKVIALLPIDFSFHFNQKAITQGWLAGDVTFQETKSMMTNDTLWTQATPSERANYIRHLAIMGLLDEGYLKTTKLTDVPLYNPELNQFAMIASMNPLYSPEGEPPKTLQDLDKDALRERIEQLCGKMCSTTEGLDSVTTKTTDSNGDTTKTDHDCSGASNKIILVVPEDPGLKEAIEAIIAEANTRGVEIEVVAQYGNGASQSEQP